MVKVILGITAEDALESFILMHAQRSGPSISPGFGQGCGASHTNLLHFGGCRVKAMHRMYMAKDHTDFTVFGKEVDHEFKTMFFWKGSVWLEKGVG